MQFSLNWCMLVTFVIFSLLQCWGNDKHVNSKYDDWWMVNDWNTFNDGITEILLLEWLLIACKSSNNDVRISCSLNVPNVNEKCNKMIVNKIDIDIFFFKAGFEGFFLCAFCSVGMRFATLHPWFLCAAVFVGFQAILVDTKPGR